MPTTAARLFVIALLGLAASSASAFELLCQGVANGKNLRLVYDDQSGSLISQKLSDNEDMIDEAPTRTDDVLFSKDGPGIVALKSVSKELVARLKVNGHPMRSVVSLIDGKVEHSCIVTGDTRPLYETLIDNPKTQDAIKAWRQWEMERPVACDVSMDSQAYFQPGAANKIALVLHGFSSSPARMNQVIQSLLDNGFNVIAPRLSHHYVNNLRDLDNASYADWIRDAEAGYQLALKFSPHVTLAGFSLGGVLVSMLAVEHPESINRMLLFAPAWRINAMADAASIIGAWIGNGESLNDIYNLPIACKIDQGFGSSLGARQIELLLEKIEKKFKGVYPASIPSIFMDMNAPTYVFTTPGDEAIRVDQVTEICGQHKIRCHSFSVPGRTHSTIIDDLSLKVDGSNKSMADVIAKALH